MIATLNMNSTKVQNPRC